MFFGATFNKEAAAKQDVFTHKDNVIFPQNSKAILTPYWKGRDEITQCLKWKKEKKNTLYFFHCHLPHSGIFYHYFYMSG